MLMEGLAVQAIVETSLREDSEYLRLRQISVRRSHMAFDQPDVLAKIEDSILFDQTIAPDFDKLVSSSRRVLFIDNSVASLKKYSH